MRPLTEHQRAMLVRRIEREIAWYYAKAWERDAYRALASSLVKGMEWTGVHGASEKRAVELVVARLNEEAETA